MPGKLLILWGTFTGRNVSLCGDGVVHRFYVFRQGEAILGALQYPISGYHWGEFTQDCKDWVKFSHMPEYALPLETEASESEK